jgi:tRNA(Ile)-lysidine synthase
LKKELFLKKADHIRIPTDSLLQLHPQADYLHLLFSEYGFNDLPALQQIISAGSGKMLLSGGFRLVKDRDFLLLQEITGAAEQVYGLRAEKGKIHIPIEISVVEVSEMDVQAPDILYVDKETLNPVLTLRKWKKGDYFYPLGMKGRKLVSKYYKDEKMDMIAKENQWLLCSGDAIVWIVGRRADDRFKVRRATTSILKIKGNP